MSPFLSLANAKQANEGEIEGFALQLRTKSKHKATKGFALQLRPDRRFCFFLSTKGAYYGANYLCLLLCIFLSTKGAYYGANYP
jgi:hypothetical protein